MNPQNQNKQVNIRLDDETLYLIDRCRTEKMADLGKIPTRSDIVRMAIERYLAEECGKSNANSQPN